MSTEMPEWERRLRELLDILDATMPGNTHAQHIRACLAALDAARALARELADQVEVLDQITGHSAAALDDCPVCELLTSPDVRALREQP